MKKKKKHLEKLKEIKNIDFDLLKQFKESLEDIKSGRIRRVK